MYKVTEVFEYLVNDNTNFLSAHDILDWVAGMTCPLWDGYQDMLPKNSEGEEEYIPWGKSELSSVNLSNDKAFIDKKVLLMLIQNSEKLEAEGVDNWEGYSLAMKELNIGYQKDAITNEVLLKQYLDD